VSDIRAGTCAEPGPYDTHCTEHPRHRYSCYDAGDDSSWNDRQDWTHDHAGCPDDGLVNEGD
jgi:hypothetical protein